MTEETYQSKQNDLAFPVEFTYPNGHKEFNNGLTKIQYACIHLKLPKSGTLWLDALIQESNQNDINLYT